MTNRRRIYLEHTIYGIKLDPCACKAKYCLYAYGIDVFKEALRYFQDNEMYEICAIMKSAIQKHNVLSNDTLTTVL